MPRRPVDAPYTITTEFGVRDSYAKFGYHSGVDYAVPLNRQILAPASGTLQNIVSPTGGNMVVIYDGKYWLRLMHNNSFSRGNGWVNEGQEAAKAGTTGLSTGVHCHWDINSEGIYPTSFAAFIPPADYLAGKYPVNVSTERDKVMTPQEEADAYNTVLQRPMEHGGSGRTGYKFIVDAKPELNAQRSANAAKSLAYETLQAQVAELSARPTKAELQAVVQTVNSERDKIAVLEAALVAEKANIKTIEVVKEITKEVQIPVNEKEVVKGFFTKLWIKLTALFWGKG